MAASTSIAAMHARITYLISQSAAPSGMDGWMDGWMDGYACTSAILFVDTKQSRDQCNLACLACICHSRIT